MLKDILIIGAAGLVLTSGAFTQSSAESAEDAARLIAEISAELTEESRLSLARVDDLEDRLATGFDNLAAIAEEMDVQMGRVNRRGSQGRESRTGCYPGP